MTRIQNQKNSPGATDAGGARCRTVTSGKAMQVRSQTKNHQGATFSALSIVPRNGAGCNRKGEIFMAKLKKRADGLYQVSAMVEERGERKRKVFYGHTQQEARQKAIAYKEKQAAGRMFEVVADEWQDKHWSEIRAGTQNCYKPAYKRALEDFSGKPIGSIAPLDVKRAIDTMGKKGYAHHTVGIYLSVLTQIFDYAILMKDIDLNPTDKVKIPKGLTTTRRECPDDEKLETIRQNADVHPFGLFPYMLMYTGLRRGELLALQWKDVDFGARTINVTKAVSYAATGNTAEIEHTKTKAGERKVVLLDRLAKKLLPLRGKPDEYIFGGKTPLTLHVFMRRWRNYCIDVGLFEWKEVLRDDKKAAKEGKKKKVTVLIKDPTVTPHQLRHAYATMCFELGIDAKDAQQLLGHSKIDVTLDTYTHIRKNRLADVAAKLNRAE